jgi:exodeoxyribonuclease-3
MYKIATWNVNSLRVRLPHVLKWLERVQPDILALQETKLQDPDFPLLELQSVGYQVIYAGQKTYNGMALLSRTPALDIVTDFSVPDPQRRLLAATVNNLRIINAYVPNGSSPGSEKYQYKLGWLTKFHDFILQQYQQYPHLVVVGDFNIAPEDRDVHDPQVWEGQVMVSPLERQALLEIINLGFVDAFRLFSDASEFSWWDYRGGAFWKNLGLRIDHILLSEPLVKACKQCYIDKSPRKWQQPSDHAPVVVEIEV